MEPRNTRNEDFNELGLLFRVFSVFYGSYEFVMQLATTIYLESYTLALHTGLSVGSRSDYGTTEYT